MASWNDPDSWAALRSGATCPICVRGEPRDLVATLDAGWVTMQEAAPARGYACLVARVHAVELHDLDGPTAAAFMRDAQAVSRAVAAVTGAVKLNYAMHGNVLPHLHMHVVPRYRGDRFEGRPLDLGSPTGPVYSPGEFERVRDAVLDALHAAPAPLGAPLR